MPNEQKSLAEIVREELKDKSLEEFESHEGSVYLYRPRFRSLPRFLGKFRFLKSEVIHIYNSMIYTNIEVKDGKYLALAKGLGERIKGYGNEVKIEYKEK